MAQAKRRRAGLIVAALVAAIVAPSVSHPATALPIPLLGDNDGGSRKRQATPSPEAPPSGGTTINGESLSGVTRVNDPRAHGDAFGRTLEASASPQLAGYYLLRARLRSASAARADLLAAGRMTGSYAVNSTWKTVESVVYLTSTAGTVGIRAVPLPGADQPRQVDIDWLHLSSVAPGFTTRGNTILDLTGARFRPRGVNRPGFHIPNPGNGELTVPASDAQNMWIWGANTVRVPLNQEMWLANCRVRSGAQLLPYRAAAIQAVTEITDLGMLALVELAVSSRGRNTGCRPAVKPYIKEMADTRSVPFWESVATTFGLNPLVAFDLYNEPHEISWGIWRSGGTVTYDTVVGPVQGPTASYKAVGMQRLYRAVRSRGARNLVFVAGSNWATNPRVALDKPLDGYNIVLSSHNYCGDACADGRPRLPPLIDGQLTEEVRARHPVVITETGWWRPTDGRFNRMIIDYANQHGELGWLIFAWMQPDQEADQREFSIIERWELNWPAGRDVLTRPPTKSGVPVWNELAPIRVARGFAANIVPEQ